MIKGLMGTCGVTVSAGNTALPYVGPNVSNPMTGMIRIQNTDMEVFNGSSWQQLSTSYATVSLDQEKLVLTNNDTIVAMVAAGQSNVVSFLISTLPV